METFGLLLASAATELQDMQDQLNEAVSRAAWRDVADLAHRGVGIALALAAQDLANAARTIEARAERGETNQIGEAVQEFERQLIRVFAFDPTLECAGYLA